MVGARKVMNGRQQLTFRLRKRRTGVSGWLGNRKNRASFWFARSCLFTSSPFVADLTVSQCQQKIAPEFSGWQCESRVRLWKFNRFDFCDALLLVQTMRVLTTEMLNFPRTSGYFEHLHSHSSHKSFISVLEYFDKLANPLMRLAAHSAAKFRIS